MTTRSYFYKDITNDHVLQAHLSCNTKSTSNFENKPHNNKQTTFPRSILFRRNRANLSISFLPKKLSKLDQQAKLKNILYSESRKLSKSYLDNCLTRQVLLAASKADTPSDVTYAVLSNKSLTKTAPEELIEFSNLQFLDIGENRLRIGDVLLLTNLEELHIHCNEISSLEELSSALPKVTQGIRLDLCENNSRGESISDIGLFSPQNLSYDYRHSDKCTYSIFPFLRKLNLSYNRLSSSQLIFLEKLPSLTELDLSSNNLTYLPSDLSFLKHVSYLSLEKNNFSDSSDIWQALGTMPALLEVNLNRNRLSHLPLEVFSDEEHTFPNLKKVSLVKNLFATFQDLKLLLTLKNLECVSIFENPVVYARKELNILSRSFEEVGIKVVSSSPVLSKWSWRKICTSNKKCFKKVSPSLIRDFRDKTYILLSHPSPRRKIFRNDIVNSQQAKDFLMLSGEGNSLCSSSGYQSNSKPEGFCETVFVTQISGGIHSLPGSQIGKDLSPEVSLPVEGVLKKEKHMREKINLFSNRDFSVSIKKAPSVFRNANPTMRELQLSLLEPLPPLPRSLNQRFQALKDSNFQINEDLQA